MIDSKHTAAVLVGMQNAFCRPMGSSWKRGFAISNIESVLGVSRALVSFCHNNAITVIFTRLQYKPDYSDSGLLIRERAPEIVKLGGYVENTWDSQIVESVGRQDHDIVIVKNRYDPFCKTQLESILSERAIDHLIVGGVLTNVCVESCVRSAFDRDFRVTVVSDATATYSQELYQESLINMSKHFAKVMSFDELRHS